MTFMNRRKFVQLSGGACLAGGLTPAAEPVVAEPTTVTADSGASPIRIGLVVWIGEGQSIDAAIRRVHRLGLPTCQIGFRHLTAEVVAPVKEALSKYGVEATAFSEHGPGQRIFDFYRGPETIGIVPPTTRPARIANLKLAADVAARCGIPAIHTHCGFIPENPNDPLYPQAVAAVKEVAEHCRERGTIFLCEAGEETPTTLLRLIQDVGTGNVFVNLDLANLILYGKGNPVDAMTVFGRYVRGVHAKDGLFPTGTRELGKPVPFGQGDVDFPAIIKRLRQVGYTGSLTIEMETEGGQSDQQILQSKAFLQRLIRSS